MFKKCWYGVSFNSFKKTNINSVLTPFAVTNLSSLPRIHSFALRTPSALSYFVRCETVVVFWAGLATSNLIQVLSRVAWSCKHIECYDWAIKYLHCVFLYVYSSFITDTFFFKGYVRVNGRGFQRELLHAIWLHNFLNLELKVFSCWSLKLLISVTKSRQSIDIDQQRYSKRYFGNNTLFDLVAKNNMIIQSYLAR